MNERYNLKDFKESAIIPSVFGLGYENNTSYIRVGNSYRLDKKEIKQGEFIGTAIFKSYENYQNFISFVEKSEKLRVIYKPLDIEYFRDVDLNGITATINKGSTTESEISLSCKGLYYTEDSKRFIIEELEGETRYPILFDATFNDYSSVAVDYDNKGHAEGEILAEIYGYTEQPTIELFVGDKLKYKVIFDITIQAGEKLLYSAKDGDNFVALEDANGVQTNVPECMKLDNDNFFKLPKGMSTIKTTSTTGTMNTIIFRIFTAYKGV